MLETIREFGLEQLDAAGEAAGARWAHAVWVLDFAEIAGIHLWGAEQGKWMRGIEAQHDNVRAALAWVAEQGAAPNDLALRIGESLWLFWQTRSHIKEGRDGLEAAVDRPGGRPWARASALNVAGMLAWVQEDYAHARALTVMARNMWEALNHYIGRARSLFLLSTVAWREGDYGAMVAGVQQALPLFLEWEDAVGAGMCLVSLGIVAHVTGDDQQALAGRSR